MSDSVNVNTPKVSTQHTREVSKNPKTQEKKNFKKIDGKETLSQVKKNTFESSAQKRERIRGEAVNYNSIYQEPETAGFKKVEGLQGTVHKVEQGKNGSIKETTINKDSKGNIEVTIRNKRENKLDVVQDTYKSDGHGFFTGEKNREHYATNFEENGKSETIKKSYTATQGPNDKLTQTSKVNNTENSPSAEGKRIQGELNDIKNIIANPDKYGFKKQDNGMFTKTDGNKEETLMVGKDGKIYKSTKNTNGNKVFNVLDTYNTDSKGAFSKEEYRKTSIDGGKTFESEKFVYKERDKDISDTCKEMVSDLSKQFQTTFNGTGDALKNSVNSILAPFTSLIKGFSEQEKKVTHTPTKAETGKTNLTQPKQQNPIPYYDTSVFPDTRTPIEKMREQQTGTRMER